MAIVKQIVEVDGTSRYNFLSSDRLRIEEHSHTSEEAGDGGVSQIFNLILADTQDNIRDAVVELEHRLTQAVYWHTQNMSSRSLWWNEQSEGESAKRSLITGFSLRPLTDDIQNPQVLEANGARYRCVITHRAEFEETAPDSYITSAVTMAGGEWTPGAGGGQATFDHRISHIKLTPSAQIEKWWIGILPKYYNTDPATNFSPEAYFTNGTAVGGSDTTIINDSANGAVGGAPNTARVTFATNATMISRAYKLLYDPSYSGSMRGRFTVLARFRLTNPTTTNVGFRIGMSFRTPSSKYFTADWQQTRYFGMSSNYSLYTLAEIGEIQIPPTSYRYDLLSEPVEFTEYLNFAAERIEGTGQLYCNGFLLIPADHQIIVENGIATSAIPLHIFTAEDYTIDAFAVQSSNDQVQSRFEVTARNWRFPRYGGVVVVTGQVDSEHDGSITADIEMDVYRTWRLYRV